MDWFVWLLFGHLFGDYVFQPQWMALNKKKNLAICIVHCTVYTACILMGLYLAECIELTVVLALLIFASHFVIDYTHVIDKWVKFCGIRSWDSALVKSPAGHINMHEILRTHQVVQVAFGALVYVVIDNTLHLFIMFLIINNFYIIY